MTQRSRLCTVLAENLSTSSSPRTVSQQVSGDLIPSSLSEDKCTHRHISLPYIHIHKTVTIPTNKYLGKKWLFRI